MIPEVGENVKAVYFFEKRGGSVSCSCEHPISVSLSSHCSIRTFEEWNETRPGFLEADLLQTFEEQWQAEVIHG
jgi:hypothetical protein